MTLTYFKKSILTGILLCLSVEAFATTSLTLDSTKRLKAKISKDSMNRIAVINDRITQVFGDNEAYEIQTEETTGQVFIKPTVDNGDKPLSVTLITENNITQDLMLEPVQKEASTLILKVHSTPSLSPVEPRGAPGMGISPGSALTSYQSYGPKALSFQESLLEAMKKLVLEQAEKMDLETEPQHKGRAGCVVSFTRAYTLGDLKGFVFSVRNNTETTIEVKEEDFFQEGDLAMSLEKLVLNPNEATHLYVVSR